MSQPEAPKIEFPCQYPIKVIGHAAPDFKDFVIRSVSVHAPDLDVDLIEINASRNARFLSVRISIMAQSEQQLMAIFQDLKASGRVQMVM
ncbi:MAG: DUF493 domain-containing protein [Hahellaceae bacterium]|nr:DUF493 domain-containing protein [Hahellaceae bacterium]MCP5169901.1 DUF493 domain-containing protein [Hahellaceae bacterium]